MTVSGPSPMGSAMVGDAATVASSSRWGFSWAKSKASTWPRSSGLPAQARSRNAARSAPYGISIADRKIDFSVSATIQASAGGPVYERQGEMGAEARPQSGLPGNQVGASRFSFAWSHAAVSTLTTVEALTPLAVSVAVIVAVPDFACAFAKPLPSITTTSSADELHSTAVVKSCLVPSEYAPVALNCCLPPPGIDAPFGLIVIDSSALRGGSLFTVTTVNPLVQVPSSVAVIVALPVTNSVVARPLRSITSQS